MSDMNGKTVLITGANQGIGKASAIALGKMGASLVLVCRNAEKARAAIAEIESAGAKPVELLVGDLASQADVRRIAAELKARHARLDVLMNNAGVLVPGRRVTVDGIEETLAINHLGPFLLTNLLLDVLMNNAGVLVPSRRVTVDGLEETLAINHLGPFLLTNLLLDVIKASGPARIVNVSSTAHYRGKMNWDDLQYARTRYSAMGVYSQSKLCNILFTRELARRLEGTGVTANSLHPGVIASGFGQTYGGFFSVMIKIARPFFLTTEEGARTQVWLASSPDVAGVSGKYFDKCAEKKPSREARDESAPRRLWDVSETLTGLRAAASSAA